MNIRFKHAAAVASLLAATSFQSPAADLPDGLYAELDTTKGKIVLQLEFEKVPLTVANFVGLAEGTKHYIKWKDAAHYMEENFILDENKRPAGRKPPEQRKLQPTLQNKPYYDGLVFHRVIPGFMIQGGCPLGQGNGDPGYKFADEFDPSLRHDKAGILSMANSGPGSNGSQFFITEGPTPHLDDRHSVFGRVVQGQDVVSAIANAPRGAQDRPNEEIKINKVKIIRQGDKASAFKADQAAFDQLLGAAMAKRASAEQDRLAKEMERMEQQRKEAAELAEKQPALIEQAIKDLKAANPKAEVVTTQSGLRYMVLKEGAGAKPVKGASISAHYTGKLANGKVFDSSINRGQPIRFPVGQGMVIAGWDEALSDMKKGEKRVLIIPADLAYGKRGAGGVIPPDATLIFEVELVDF